MNGLFCADVSLRNYSLAVRNFVDNTIHLRTTLLARGCAHYWKRKKEKRKEVLIPFSRTKVPLAKGAIVPFGRYVHLWIPDYRPVKHCVRWGLVP